MRSFITKHALLLLLLHGAKQEVREAGRQGQEEEGGGEGGREKRSCLLLSGSLVEVGEEPLGFPVHWTTDLGLEFGPRQLPVDGNSLYLIFSNQRPWSPGIQRHFKTKNLRKQQRQQKLVEQATGQLISHLAPQALREAGVRLVH